MAEVRIAHFSGEAVTLPPVCMRCGAAADMIRTRNFRHIPKWAQTVFLLPYQLLLIPLAYLFFGLRVRVRAPMCRRHRNHWRIRSLIYWGGLPAAAAVTALLYALFEYGVIRTSTRIEGLLTFVGLVAAWVAAMVVNDWTAIRSLHIDDEGIVLTGVSPDFVRALGDQQLCVKCGYDLKGNVSGACPECGTGAPTRRPAPMTGGGRA